MPSLDASFATSMAALAPIEPRAHLAVAVSGGPDSRALALLAKTWAGNHGATLSALVVDHGLRPDSAAETAETIRWLNGQAIPSYALTVQVAREGNLPQAARDARYTALTEWCRDHGIVHLLLGHHHDDQMETILQRLIRGSGVDGLAAMAPVAWRRDVRLLRPLLGVTKDGLVDYLKQRGASWINDPSNASLAFSRNRLRALLAALGEEGLSPARLRETGERLYATREYLSGELARFLARHVHLSMAGWALVDSAAFCEAADEIALRGLRALLATIRGRLERPRFAEVKHLLHAIRQPDFPGATLHGCRLFPTRKGRMIIFRERIPEPMPLDAPCRWDDRFEASATSSRLTLRALGPDGLAQLRHEPHSIPSGMPALLLHALPSVWQLDRCLAIPHIDYGASLESLGVSLRFAPRNPLC